MKVTYNYNTQCCLTAAAKAFALFVFAIPPASAQPSGITSIIRWSVGTSDNFSSATQYRNSARAIQQRPAGSDYLTVQLGDRQATFTRSAARLLLLALSCLVRPLTLNLLSVQPSIMPYHRGDHITSP